MDVRTDGRTDVRTDGRTEFLPILQDFVPCRGRCPKRITNIQKRAIRTIAISYSTSHTEPRMKQTKILNFEDTYKHQTLLLTFDCIHNIAPSELCKLIKPEIICDGPTLRSHASNSINLIPPRSNTKVTSYSFSVNGPNLWNSIPEELKTLKKRHIFKESIKRSFLNNYHNKAVCSNPRCRDVRYHTAN